MSLPGLRAELADQAAEMDQRGFDPLPGARMRGRRIRLRHRVVATAGGLTLLAGFFTTLPDRAEPHPAPPVAAMPNEGWPAVKPEIAVGRTVVLSPGVTVRFDSHNVATITAPGQQTVRVKLDAAHPTAPTSIQWLLSGPLPNGEAQVVALVGNWPACPAGPPSDRVRINVSLDGQVKQSYPAEIHPLSFDAGLTLVYLRYPLNGFVMTSRNAGPRDPHGVFLTHTTYQDSCIPG